MSENSGAKQDSERTKKSRVTFKAKQSPLYFYLSGIAIAALFVIPAACLQTFAILDGSVLQDGKIQWDIFIMPLVVITIAGLLIGRIRLLSHLLQQSNAQQQRELLNNTSSVVYMKDMEGRYLFVNQKFEKLLQLSEQEILGKTDYDIMPSANADAYRRNDLMAIDADKPLEFDEVITLDDGNHTYISVKFPLKNTAGEIYACCGMSTDITERINMEEALRRSQKMDAIGQLTGGIAHDFNNQLGVIMGYLAFLKEYVAEKEKPLKWIETASSAAQRCANLTQQLLTFSRDKPQQTAVVNLNDAFIDMNNILSYSVTPAVKIHYTLADNLWPVKTDLGELQDVILNLAINARDAMPDGGKFIIETCKVKLDSNHTNLNQRAKAGDYVQIKLSDTGDGMDKETLEHIYEPFYTTKPEGKGTGLGLAMVYGFIERYNGYIEVHSAPGLGTSFQLYLPRSTTSESTTTEKIIDDGEQLTGNESILIVDDEVALLQLADQYLSDLGYRTYTAENATKALQILEDVKNIDMVFSDVVMPGNTNGYELAQQAVQQRPELKILLTSGFTSKNVEKSNSEKFSEYLLYKPYTKLQLAQQIRLVLEDKAASNKKFS